MEDALQEVIGASAQLFVTFVIVGLLWLGHRMIASLRSAERSPFRQWVGLVRPTDSLKPRLLLVGGLVLFNLAVSALEHLLGLSDLIAEIAKTGPVFDLAQIEPTSAAVLAGLAYAFLRTGGAEELVFRGALYKRLIQWFGVGPANHAQAFIFTIMHNGIIYMAMPEASLWVHVDFFIRIYVLSWIVGWYMERRDNGSLLMPWICHGVANFMTFLAFFIA